MKKLIYPVQYRLVSDSRRLYVFTFTNHNNILIKELHEYLLKRNEELIAMSIVKESIEEEINRIKNSAAISESQVQGLNSTVSFLE